MNANPTQEDRELLLSRYIDGELSAEEQTQVEELLRNEPQWRNEYLHVRSSETKISKVVSENWHDEVLTEKVLTKLRDTPSPTRKAKPVGEDGEAIEDEASLGIGPDVDPAVAAAHLAVNFSGETSGQEIPPKLLRGRGRMIVVGLALLAVAAGAAALFWGEKPDTTPETARIHVAWVPPEGGTLEGAAPEASPDSEPPEEGALPWWDGQELQAAEDLVRLRYGRDVILLVHAGARLRSISEHSLELLSGEVLAQVPQRRIPFAIKSQSGVVETKGGWVEVIRATKTNPEGEHEQLIRKRVFLGEAEFKRTSSSAPINLRAGWLIEEGTKVSAFEPQEALQPWFVRLDVRYAGKENIVRDAFPLWAQFRGGPGNEGYTNGEGPDFIRSIRFDPLPGKGLGPVLVGPVGTLFVCRILENGQTQVYRALPKEGFRRLGEPVPGAVVLSPCLTSDGQLVLATSAKLVRSLEQKSGKILWQRETEAAIHGLSVGYDNRLYLSTFSGLLCWDATGEQLWAYRGLTDIRAPIVSAGDKDGSIWVFARTGRFSRLGPGGSPMQADSFPARLTVDRPPVRVTAWSERLLPGDEDESATRVWVVNDRGELFSFSTERRILGGAPIATGIDGVPLGSGVRAEGKELVFPLTKVDLRYPLKNAAPIAALAEDKNFVYAGAGKKFYRVRVRRNQGEAPRPISEHPEVVDIKAGEMIPFGVTVAPSPYGTRGRVLLHTTSGVETLK